MSQRSVNCKKCILQVDFCVLYLAEDNRYNLFQAHFAATWFQRTELDIAD